MSLKPSLTQCLMTT